MMTCHLFNAMPLSGSIWLLDKIVNKIKIKNKNKKPPIFIEAKALENVVSELAPFCLSLSVKHCIYKAYWWFNARLQYLLCVSTGDTGVLH